MFVEQAADVDDRLALMEGMPHIFHSTEHYDGGAMVIVQLDEINESRLAELLVDSYAVAVAKGPIRR